MTNYNRDKEIVPAFSEMFKSTVPLLAALIASI
jgi:hypothetical protein